MFIVRVMLGLVVVAAGGLAHGKDGDVAADWGMFLKGRQAVSFDLAGGKNDYMSDLLALPDGGGSVAVGQVDCISLAGCIGISKLGWDGTVEKKTAFAPFIAGLKKIAVRSAAIDIEGRVLVGGDYTTQQDNAGFFAARFDTLGKPVNFPGAVTNTMFRAFDFPPDNVAYLGKVLALPSGGFALVGRTPGLKVGVMKFNANATPDKIFNGSGMATYDLPAYGQMETYDAAYADGKIVIVGEGNIKGIYPSDKDMFVLRILAITGAKDTEFGTSGVVNLAFDLGPPGDRRDVASAVLVESDGKIVLAGAAETGASTNKGVLVKLNKNGSVLFKTLSIGNSTWLTYSEILRQDDGKYLVMGTRSVGDLGYDIEVDRFHPTGNLDMGFAIGGRAMLDFFSGEAEVGSAIALDSNGHILLGGAGKTLNGFGSDYLLVALTLGVIQ